MKNLKTLSAVAIGAFVMSLAYAIAFNDDGDGDFDVEFDDENGHSVRHIVNGDRGEFVRRDDDGALKASWRGDFELSNNGNGLKSLERKLEIETDDDDETRRVVFKDNDGSIETAYFIGDEEQPAGEETNAAAADLFLQFLRASGVRSDERVKALLKTGGVETVLAEFDHLDGDDAFRRYAVALVEESDLSTEEITHLADKLKSVESDHDRRLVLRAILEHETLSPETTPLLIRAARSIESDHDLRLLVEAFAERKLNNDAMDLALGLYGRIESDHDLRISAEALLENAALTKLQAARVLEVAADEIESDHDMRLLLTETAAMFSEEPALTDAWLQGFATLESGHDQRLSIEAVAENAKPASSGWLALIDASSDIDSDHDARRALEAIAGNMGDEAELLDAYRAVAERIGSSSDRDRALAAIDGEE